MSYTQEGNVKPLDMMEGGTVCAYGPLKMDDVVRSETVVQGTGKMLDETLSRTESVIITNA